MHDVKIAIDRQPATEKASLGSARSVTLFHSSYGSELKGRDGMSDPKDRFLIRLASDIILTSLATEFLNNLPASESPVVSIFISKVLLLPLGFFMFLWIVRS